MARRSDSSGQQRARFSHFVFGPGFHSAVGLGDEWAALGLAPSLVSVISYENVTGGCCQGRWVLSGAVGVVMGGALFLMAQTPPGVLRAPRPCLGLPRKAGSFQGPHSN